MMEQIEDGTFDLRSLLGSEDRDFFIRSNGERVKISSLQGKEYFTAYFFDMPMPWLAVPFSGRDLGEPFGDMSLPSLVVLDANGKVVTGKGVDLANRYRGVAYPFTEERIRKLEEEEAAML